jgi:beta-glucanase (GH16 family)
MTTPAKPSARRVSARVEVPPAARYTGELPVLKPPTPPRTSETTWRNVALTLATVLFFTLGGVVIFWPHGGGAGQQAGPAGASPSGPAGRPTAAARTAAPSGVAMPVGDLPGWHQTFADDFTTTDPTKRWFVYQGAPGGDPGGWFLRSHVTQSNGRLLITASRASTPVGNIYATGGVSNSKVFAQTYGRFEFRFRMDQGYGVNFAMLLWPSDNSWPPEVDVAESDGITPRYVIATLHYGPQALSIHRFRKGVTDFTQWHTAGVVWEPGKLTYTLDGKAWSSMSSPSVPNIPMSMTMQAQAWPCGFSFSDCPNSRTPAKVNLEVDWAVAYRATGATRTQSPTRLW